MSDLIERIKNRIENELHNIYELSTAIEIINEEQAKDPQEDIQKDELLEILDKIDFFNQRAGRELWSEKNREVQDIDISNISDDIEKLRSYIAKAQPIVRSAEQRIEMSEFIERIRLVLSPYRNFNHHIAVVDELIELIDEESAKEQQEEHKCSECVRESIQAECVLDGCKFHAKEPQECEWNYDGDGYYLHGNDLISGKSDFQYCPYCGRKIKVGK